MCYIGIHNINKAIRHCGANASYMYIYRVFTKHAYLLFLNNVIQNLIFEDHIFKLLKLLYY